MKAEEIIWEGQYDDYTARVDGYVLRAEDMGAGLWWWCCYHPDNTQSDVYTDDWADTEAEAKEKAANAMKRHRERSA
jgi:hypothetical protein